MSVRWEYTEAEQAAILATFPDELRERILGPEPERRRDPELLREELLLNVAITVGFYREHAIFPDYKQKRAAADALGSLAKLADQMLKEIDELKGLAHYGSIAGPVGLEGLRPRLLLVSQKVKLAAEHLVPSVGRPPGEAHVALLSSLADLWVEYAGTRATCYYTRMSDGEPLSGTWPAFVDACLAPALGPQELASCRSQLRGVFRSYRKAGRL